MQQPASNFKFAVPYTHSNANVQSVQWLLKRNCCLSPTQIGRFYASLCVVSLGIAAFFWSMGATLVMPFAWLELLIVGVALLVHARHASDLENIVLGNGRLVVELETAGKTRRAEFNAQWVRVTTGDAEGALIEVSGQGRTVMVGRHVRPELRPALAREIRLALVAS